MALFGFGKKKEEEKTSPVCTCGGGAPTAAEVESVCCPGGKGNVCCIKVLGTGCKSCHEQYENAKEAVKNMGLDVAVEYITDLQKVMTYGAMRMPALVIDEKVVAMGKVLKAADVENLLRQRGV